ncbi:hypothetical protein [Streptomyces swartbergensis]|uniref:hypothetical protein n=1 Tax=Streptomyces swartbergensis TaxID=487165 RepID=UPI0037F9EC4D
MLKVTLSGADGDTTLNRHRMTSGRAAYAETVDSAEVPVGGSLAMSPSGLDVTLRAKPGWREFDFDGLADPLTHRHTTSLALPLTWQGQNPTSSSAF